MLSPKTVPEVDQNITFDQTAIGAAIISLNGQWLRVNRKILDILGYFEEDLLATDWQSITHPDDVHSDQQLVNHLLTGKLHQYSMDKRYIRKDGKVIWAQLNVTLIRDNDGNPLHFLSQVQDIQEQKLTRILLEENKLRFEELARNSKTVLWQINRDGLYTHISEVVQDLLGYSPDDLVGKVHFYDLSPKDQRHSLRDTITLIIQSQKPFREFENCVVARDGSIVWRSTNGMPQFDSMGNHIGYQGGTWTSRSEN